jgi:HD superfamily phosphohydrolase
MYIVYLKATGPLEADMNTAWETAEKKLKEEINQYAQWAFQKHERTEPRDWKIVQDILDGTSRFEPWEIAILDTPIVQRLRRIGQTGLSSLLYPSANASRFEHSLGVAVVTGRIIFALNAQRRQQGVQHPFTEEDYHCTRAAALLHDTGHGPFSHCCEDFCLNTFPELRTLIESDESPYAHCKAHELISAYIVQSPTVEEFFKWLTDKFQVRIVAEKVSRMILQLPDKDNLAYVYQVVNGPFDADKLDYIRRDSYVTGLQMALELDRLIHSLSKGNNERKGRSQEVILIGTGGVPAVEQILFSKMLLTTALYHHHKVRAIESMLTEALRYITTTQSSFLGRQIGSPADLLYLDDVHVLAASRENGTAGDLISDILDRKIVKRALVISAEAADREDQHAKYFLLVKEMMRSQEKRETLKNQICGELATRGVTLSDGERVRIYVNFPKPPSFSEPSYTYVLRENGIPTQLDELFSMETWLEAYRQLFWRGHVFAPESIRAKVDVTARRVLERDYGVHLSDIALDQCKYKEDWRQVERNLNLNQ